MIYDHNWRPAVIFLAFRAVMIVLDRMDDREDSE
jgi:hypothetical protein